MTNITVLERLRKLAKNYSLVAERYGRGEEDKRVLDEQDSEEEYRTEENKLMYQV